MDYLSNFITSFINIVFIIFIIAAVGYIIGGIEIKGISLGTAGILLVALVFGIITSNIPSFFIGDVEIYLFDASMKAKFSMISNLGTAMFVTAVGLIAGPKFFRTFNRKSIAYILLGVCVIVIGTLTTVIFILFDNELSPSMAVGLMTGALTSTPGLSAAKEVSNADADMVTAGYGIAYLFGVLGVVFFVQIVPRLLHIDIEKEREAYVMANVISIKRHEKKLKSFDPMGFFPFMLTIAFGCLIGAIEIPGINFSLGMSGGTLLAGLIIGHFGYIGKIDCSIKKETLNYFRELGLVLFLIGAGVPGGANFINNVQLSYFIYGAIMTTVPMIAGFFIAKCIFKLSIFNNLGSITGGMTSTPALGALIKMAGTDDVSSAYAATYPVALVSVVIASKLIIIMM